MTVKVGVLLSGRGSNFLALADAVAAKKIPAEIALVVANVAAAPGLTAARDRRIATAVVPHENAATREEHDARIVTLLQAAGVDWVCLAGYMRILSPVLIEAFPHRVLNIHPSLLPAFPGLHAQRQALQHGVKVAGCTVHFVDAGLDSGPIVAQRTVPVEEDDDEASLANRILSQEHVAYPEALRRLLLETWRVDGRRVRFGALGRLLVREPKVDKKTARRGLTG